MQCGHLQVINLYKQFNTVYHKSATLFKGATFQLHSTAWNSYCMMSSKPHYKSEHSIRVYTHVWSSSFTLHIAVSWWSIISNPLLKTTVTDQPLFWMGPMQTITIGNSVMPVQTGQCRCVLKNRLWNSSEFMVKDKGWTGCKTSTTLIAFFKIYRWSRWVSSIRTQTSAQHTSKGTAAASSNSAIESRSPVGYLPLHCQVTIILPFNYRTLECSTSNITQPGDFTGT